MLTLCYFHFQSCSSKDSHVWQTRRAWWQSWEDEEGRHCVLLFLYYYNCVYDSIVSYCCFLYYSTWTGVVLLSPLDALEKLLRLLAWPHSWDQRKQTSSLEPISLLMALIPIHHSFLNSQSKTQEFAYDVVLFGE